MMAAVAISRMDLDAAGLRGAAGRPRPCRVSGGHIWISRR
jgi:hypothetical protein